MLDGKRMDWEPFFPRGTSVLALPHWREPRLYLPSRSFSQRWADSSFYPASRLQARLYRFVLRGKAAAGLAARRKAWPGSWALGDFTQSVLPHVTSVVVRVG